ncbi:SIFamide-related peptide [Cimex lectularius]|uniref:SIFamide n=1 Tax=Cimex lectularius TaxID=79782 RepID=A0A8I6RIU5_CIMLE|nr:SIFamide-related peptide [Cimex lectularius]XP_024081846.1 SIFamide-related peptide [Cimex lectularius]
MSRVIFASCLLLVISFLVFDVATASYKKPPFNGSIFGKRTGPPTDYETAGKALSTMCEIASEACAAWFPVQENN